MAKLDRLLFRLGFRRASRLLVAGQLYEHFACEEQMLRFKKHFGTHVWVTEALCVKHATHVNFHWAADNLLRGRTARADYTRAEVAARADYARAEVAAREEYARAEAAAEVVYERAIAAAWARAYITDRGPTDCPRPPAPEPQEEES